MNLHVLILPRYKPNRKKKQFNEFVKRISIICGECRPNERLIMLINNELINFLGDQEMRKL